MKTRTAVKLAAQKLRQYEKQDRDLRYIAKTIHAIQEMDRVNEPTEPSPLIAELQKLYYEASSELENLGYAAPREQAAEIDVQTLGDFYDEAQTTISELQSGWYIPEDQAEDLVKRHLRPNPNYRM